MAAPPSSLSTVGDIILRSRRNLNLSSTNPSIDQAFGVAATLGLSVTIARWLLGVGQHRQIRDEEHRDGRVIVVPGGIMFAIASFIRRSLRRLLLSAEELRHYDSLAFPDELHIVDGSIITHQGSCHCQSVRFEMKAPRTLIAKDGPGKIQYRHTEVKNSNFRITRGQNTLKTYYVFTDDGQDRGGHVFCERCGCHVLFAPSRNSPQLLVNVNCMDAGIRKVRVVDKNSHLSPGSTFGQWDDHNTIISEVTRDPQIMSHSSEIARDSHMMSHSSAQLRYESVSDTSSEWKLYDEVERLDPSTHRSYYAHPQTPTTVSSYTGVETDIQSLPPFRIQQRGTDYETIITESDFFDSRSEIAFGDRSVSSIASPISSKHLPQLRDKMKYYMKKHSSQSSSPPTLPPLYNKSSRQ